MAPEIALLQGIPLVCVFGVDEEHTLCRSLTGQAITRLETKGGHHFGGDVAPVVKAIVGR